MKLLSWSALALALYLKDVQKGSAFSMPSRQTVSSRSTQLLSSLKDPPSTDEKEKTSGELASAASESDEENGEGLPWWWELIWDLDMMKRGQPGEDMIFGDTAHVFRTNIEQIYGGYPSLDGCPLAEGEINGIADGTMFIGLQNYYQEYSSPYKLCFGPKSFLVVSDPVQAKHVLREASTKYDKVKFIPRFFLK